MGRLLLIARLALRDLRHRPAQAILRPALVGAPLTYIPSRLVARAGVVPILQAEGWNHDHGLFTALFAGYNP